jgi:ankyrin repeat protein
MDGDLEYPLPPRERDFLEAARAGDVAKLRELHARGVPVDVLDNRELLCWGQTALMHAACGRHVDAVRFLLASGAKVSARDRGAGDVEHGREPLHYAMRSRNVVVAEALLDARANPNAVSHLGFTPLSVAIEEDNAEAIALLLKRGAEVNLKPRTRRYTPPLHTAVAAHKPALLRLLLEAGAEPDAPNERGETPLMYVGSASEEMAVAMVKDLLKAGARVRHVANGRTPLFMAVIHGNLAATGELLKAGADPNLIYESQQGTVLDVVEQRVHTHEKEPDSGLGRQLLQQWQAMASLLRQFNAKPMCDLHSTGKPS